MIDKYISEYVDYLVSNLGIEDEFVLNYLISLEVPDDIAFDIVNFTPISFCRKYFEGLEISFSDYFYVHNDGKTQIMKFSENKIFNISNLYFEINIAGKISKSDLITIISRSSEFNAIVKALENDVDYKNMIVKPMDFYY